MEGKVVTEAERGSAANSIESTRFHRGISGGARFVGRASSLLLGSLVSMERAKERTRRCPFRGGVRVDVAAWTFRWWSSGKWEVGRFFPRPGINRKARNGVLLKTTERRPIKTVYVAWCKINDPGSRGEVGEPSRALSARCPLV